MEVVANTTKRPWGYTEVLSFPAFRSLWFGQVCSQLAVNTLLFVLALRVYQATGSNAAVSGLFLCYGVPAVLFGMMAGTVVDQLNKRAVLVLCDSVRVLFVFALLFLSHHLAVVYVLTFFNALITQFYVPAEAPTIPRLVPSDQLLTANSLFSFTYYSSLGLGSIIAGPLLRLLGPYTIFLFISMLFGVAAWFSSHIPTDFTARTRLRSVLEKPIDRIVVRMVESLREGISYVRAAPILRDSLFLLTATQVIFAILGTLGPGFADRMLQIDVRDASLLVIGPVVLGIIVGALWLGGWSKAHHPEALIRQGVLGAGSILMLISLILVLKRSTLFSWMFVDWVTLPLVFVLFFALGVANSFLDIPANSVLQEEAKGDMRGRVYGMLTAAVGGIGILPVVVGGVLADVVGVGRVIFALGLIIVCYGVYRVRYTK